MDSKQSLAKIGVFVLLGVNVGAYYYFWPRHDGGAKAVAKAAVQDKGEAQLLPPKAPTPAPVTVPTQLPVDPLDEPMPLAIRNPPALSAERAPEPRGGAQPNDAILKLLEQIGKDDLPDLPRLPPPESARREERPRIDLAAFVPRPEEVAVASALTPKMPPGLWQVQIEKVVTRTCLTARLRDAGSERVVAEFRILCDRAETSPHTGVIQALGNVTFTGAGWKGACQAVTLQIHEPRALFEQQVEVTQDTLGTSQDGVLRGERIVWELPAPANPGVSGVTLPLNR